jgi:hypothetical protein
LNGNQRRLTKRRAEQLERRFGTGFWAFLISGKSVSKPIRLAALWARQFAGAVLSRSPHTLRGSGLLGSGSVVDGDADLASNQLSELLRLRGEVGVLRRQLTDAAKVVHERSGPAPARAGGS